jgi:hypothetical protein
MTYSLIYVQVHLNCINFILNLILPVLVLGILNLHIYKSLRPAKHQVLIFINHLSTFVKHDGVNVFYNRNVLTANKIV